MGCKDAVLPVPLLKNRTVKCLTFEEIIRQPYNDNLCPFRALALHLHGNQEQERETSKNLNLISKKNGLSSNQFQEVHLNDAPIVEDLPTLNTLLYGRDIADGKSIEGLARRSVQKYGNTTGLLRYKNQICYMSDINAVFQSFRCLICDTLFNRTFNLEQHTTFCSEPVKHVYPKNIYQIRRLYLTNSTLLVLNIRVTKNSPVI